MKSESSLEVRRWRRWLAMTVWAALLWLLPSAADAADRIAVVLSAESAADVALAENLAEVAIANLAESRSGELVGARELNRLLARKRYKKDATACVSETECLTQLREELAIALVVGGTLRRDGSRITLELQLLDANTGQQQRRVSRTSNEAVADLIQVTRESVSELFAPAPIPKVRVREAPAAAPVFALPPQSFAAANSPPVLSPLPEPPGATRSFRTAVGYGSGAIAVLSLSAAAVFGALAEQEPGGVSRREAQANLERQGVFASTANVLWISGGVLAAVSILAFTPLPGAVSTK